MLSVINRYAHGFVAMPVIASCRRSGLFRALTQAERVSFTDLVRTLNANAGHLRAALRLLQSIGWAQWHSAEDVYALTGAAELSSAVPADIETLLAFRFDDYLENAAVPACSLQPWLQLSVQQWNTDSELADYLDGVLVVPLLLKLRHRDQLSGQLLSGIHDSIKPELTSFLVAKQWCRQERGVLRATPLGRELFDRIGIVAVTASYAPMIRRLDDILFGDCQAVFQKDIRGAENHVDRTLNVIGSGFQHGKYFDDMEEAVLSIFDQQPFPAQPAYLADTGCGDGTLLKSLYEAIKTKSARGRVLDAFPLRCIGIDFNDAALAQAASTLAHVDHLLIQGDIGDPNRILIELQERGVGDADAILHVRSFLDHDRPYITPRDGKSAAARTYLCRDASGVDRNGAEIAACDQYQSLVEHMQRWAGVVGRHGLIALEVHCLEPEVVSRNLASESLHFDAYHSFSQQLLMRAERHLMASAEAGLFPQARFFKKYPKTQSFTRITLSCLERRAYTVRYARAADVPALAALEKRCWAPGMRASTKVIRDRVMHYPEGQLVLEFGNDLKACIYSQRIERSESLHGTAIDTVAKLHTPQGTIVQLLALNVSPDVQDQKLGDQLLEFMLQRCALLSDARAVVGVTRCKDFKKHSTGSLDEYIGMRNARGELLDTILRFHESHGATIQRVVRGYRPADDENEGCGVLIEYDIRFRERPESPTHLSQQVLTERAPLPDSVHIDRYVMKIIGALCGVRAGQQLDRDQPLMEMGLDSADLLELATSIGSEFQVSLSALFFFEHNTISKAVAAVLDLLRGSPNPKSSPAHGEFDIGGNGLEIAAKVLAAPTAHELVQQSSDIAIIAMSGRFPGAANITELWENLKTGRDCITEIPSERWDYHEYFDVDKDKPGKSYSKWGGFIDDVDRFDPLFFGIAPRAALAMDPQELLFLETVWDLFESAGYTRSALRRTETGKTAVYVGSMHHNEHLKRAGKNIDGAGSAHFHSSIANRVSHFFDLCGESIAIDTMCSSSAMAIHTACKDLLRGECDIAIAGGVNLLLQPSQYIFQCKSQFLGSSLNSRSFANGDGYLPAEAVGAVLLKKLSKAVADKDEIFAVIKATAANHSGRSNGYAVPDPHAQTELIEAVVAKAGIDLETISYVEAAVNGSSLADAVEIRALEKAFVVVPPNTCAIGSVKSQIGHAEAASAISQIMNVILQMRHQQLVPTRVPVSINPHMNLDRTPFRLQCELEEWTRPSIQQDGQLKEVPRRALINSFGAGGTAVSIVVEEHVQTSRCVEGANESTPTAEIIVLSAKDNARLRVVVNRLLDHIKQYPQIRLSNLAYTLQIGREPLNSRVAWVVRDGAELQCALEEYLNEQPSVSSRELQVPVYRGDSEKCGDLEWLLSGDLGELVTTTLIEKMDLNKFALLWSRGQAVPWQRLHHGKDVRKIPLPTYPFRRERLDDLADAGRSSATQVTVKHAISVLDRTHVFDNVQSFIVQFLARELGVTSNQLNSHQNFRDYGVDSLLGRRLLRALEENLAVSVTGKQLLENHDIASLSKLVSQLVKVFVESHPIADGVTVPADNHEMIVPTSVLNSQSLLMAAFLDGSIDAGKMNALIEQGSVI